MSKYHIALIEDDDWFSETIKYYLELNEENKVHLFISAEEFFQSHQKFDAVCADYQLPGMFGDELVKNVQKKNPNLPVIMVSGQENMQTTVDLLKLGVKDYIIKTEHAKDLIWKAIEELKERDSLQKQIVTLEKKLAEKTSTESIEMIGNHESIQNVKNLIQKAAQSLINVSITGETGTGKEVVAQNIHNLSERKNNAFVAVNMGAIPSEMVESELFGYEKGAFTGAIKKTKGKFELANGGTLFLDEIAELDLNLQSKILRALQEKEITPLGSEKPKKLNIRLIVASHKDIAKEVEEGNFREDLFYRIIGLPIHLPPLRERGNDLFLLADHFLKSILSKNQKETKSLSKKAKEKLMNHGFPGNIRELKAIIELAAVLSETEKIEAEDVKFNAINKKNDFYEEGLSLKDWNEKIIFHTLEKTNHNVLKTAKLLDIGKSTVYNLINKKNESSHLQN